MDIFLLGRAAGFNLSVDELKNLSWNEGWHYYKMTSKILEEIRLSSLQR